MSRDLTFWRAAHKWGLKSGLVLLPHEAEPGGRPATEAEYNGWLSFLKEEGLLESEGQLPLSLVAIPFQEETSAGVIVRCQKGWYLERPLPDELIQAVPNAITRSEIESKFQRT